MYGSQITQASNVADHWMHKMTTEVLFFVPEWPALDNPILHAQVLSVASFLKQKGIACRFAGAETSHSRAQQAAAAIKAEYDIQAYIVPGLPPHAGAWDYWASCRRAYGHMQSELASASITHVYARSFIGSMWVRRLARKLNAISIFDVRGVVGLEKQLGMKSSIKSRLLSYLELRESQKADRLSTVSQNLKRYLSLKTHSRDIIVIPSCVNETRIFFDLTARNEIRKALGLDQHTILLCYSGGSSAWQRMGDIVSLLKDICLTSPRYRSLFLTTSLPEVTNMIEQAKFPPGQAFIVSTPQNEVHRYLSAADVGLIMRHDTIVNNVASPVKVGEYLACGLPVILTRGIGDYSDMLPDASVGLLLNEDTDMVNQVVSFLERNDFTHLKHAAIRFTKSKLTMSANLNQYRLLYAPK